MCDRWPGRTQGFALRAMRRSGIESFAWLHASFVIHGNVLDYAA